MEKGLPLSSILHYYKNVPSATQIYVSVILWEICGGNGCKYLLGNIKHYFLPQECTELEITANFTCEGGCLDIYNKGKPHRPY